MNFEKMETTIKDIKEAQKETDRLLTKIALEADRRFEQMTLFAFRLNKESVDRHSLCRIDSLYSKIVNKRLTYKKIYEWINYQK